MTVSNSRYLKWPCELQKQNAEEGRVCLSNQASFDRQAISPHHPTLCNAVSCALVGFTRASSGIPVWHKVHRHGEDVYMFFPALTGQMKLKWWWRLSRFRVSVRCLHGPLGSMSQVLKFRPVRNHISMNTGSNNMLTRNDISGFTCLQLEPPVML